MNGLYGKILRERRTYFHPNGTVDWLQTIVKTVIIYQDDDAVYVVSVAADRAVEMYYNRKPRLRS